MLLNYYEVAYKSLTLHKYYLDIAVSLKWTRLKTVMHSLYIFFDKPSLHFFYQPSIQNLVRSQQRLWIKCRTDEKTIFISKLFLRYKAFFYRSKYLFEKGLELTFETYKFMYCFCTQILLLTTINLIDKDSILPNRKQVIIYQSVYSSCHVVRTFPSVWNNLVNKTFLSTFMLKGGIKYSCKVSLKSDWPSFVW